LLLFFSPLLLKSQDHYQVSRTGFSSNKFDEFSPVLYRDQLIFTSNREDELLVAYKNNKNKSLYTIFSVDADPENWSESPAAFDQNLVTPYNDGPASFSPDGKRIVYSRNIDTKARVKNIFDLDNTLGLFFAELIDGEWGNVTGFKYNSIEYSITTPCFSPDGTYLYFGSDMPGGHGGTDLYRSVFENGEWSEPENLGETINTRGNEVYPFISPNGDLFFASDGHDGMGKKDLFLSRLNDSHWITPVHLDAPINSKDDDFGLVTDGEFSAGFFSSSRDRSDDIYQFSTLVPQLFYCDTLVENQYCYEFWDDMYPGMDSLPVNYEWEFSDGTKIRGIKVIHCLPGAGKYWAKLNIVDNSTSNTFFTQTSMEFELEDHIQPFITSRDAGIVNTVLSFDGLNSNLPGYTIEEYIWEFDDGTFLTGVEAEHQFAKTGVYGVKLGVKGHTKGAEGKETRCVIKPVSIVRDNQALAMFVAGIESPEMAESGKVERDTSETSQDFSVYDVNPEEEVFRVEVLASEDKIQIEDTIFDPLREDYEIKEFYLAEDSLYSYAVGEYNSLIETYGVYGDVVEKGFTSAKVQTYMLAELPTEVIAKINRDFAELADANFEFNKTEVSENSYPILDRVVKIMMENPDLAMEIAAHTDNIGSFEFNMELSQQRAQSIVQYLISKGVDNIRLIGKGYGESRPIETNSTEEGRMNNRRVEFIILNK
jgi:outer membrane protein OmpA-like peptidoglycan-associated protein